MLLSASVFLVVATILGGVPSWWGVLAIPAAVLGASVFAAALNAYAVTQDSDLPFAVIMRIGLFPLFLFSGTFFPTSRLPDWLQPVSWFSPLWHAVELCRAATTGSSPSFGTVAGHVAFLVARAGGRLLVGRPAVHPGADRMISAIAVKEAGRRRAGSTGRGALRVVERNVLAYRRMWLAFVTGLFEPLLYLLSIGIGVGGLVGKVPGPGGQPIPYDQFVAPGLMAAAAMNGAVLDTTFNFFFKFKYAHTYDAMLATPLEVGDIAQGELTWALIRGAIYSAAFLLTMLVLGLVGSWWAVLALPAAALIAFGVRGCGDRGDDVHAVVDRLRLREPGADPDVPVRGDVLPAVAIPGGVAVGGAVHAPLPGRRARARPHHRAADLDHAPQRHLPHHPRHRRPPRRHPPSPPAPPAVDRTHTAGSGEEFAPGQATTLGVQAGRRASKVSMSATWRRVIPMSSSPSSRR